jgi:hypothetical protein
LAAVSRTFGGELFPAFRAYQFEGRKARLFFKSITTMHMKSLNTHRTQSGFSVGLLFATCLFATFAHASTIQANVAAPDVQYLVYIDESVAAGGAFYISSNSAGRDPKDCPPNPTGFGLRCTLDYALNNGIPTVTASAGFNGIISGDIAIEEAATGVGVVSDLIRFKSKGKDARGNNLGAGSLQFFSGVDFPGIPDDPAEDPADVGVFQANGLDDNNLFFDEIDLGKIPPPTLQGGNGGNLAGLPLAGKFGYYYVAGTHAIGGAGTSAARGPIGYLFISDNDTPVPKPGPVPEPGMVAPLAIALVGLFLTRAKPQKPPTPRIAPIYH